MRILARVDFKEVRMKKGLSILALSKSADMSYQGLVQVENRMNGISAERSGLIVDALGVDFDTAFEIVNK